VGKLRLSTGVLAISGAMLATGMFQSAHASCGATFCSVNTQWETQGAWTEPGIRFNLRYEYTDQDQLRNGTDKVEPAGVLDTHDEIRTLNRNLHVGMDYAFNPTWAVSLQVPVVNRDHRHVHNDVVPEYEAWSLTGLGDMRLSGRYQTALDHHAAVGVQFGLKLPTGKFDETNDLGQLAERSLQPGSGTTDALLGVYTYHQLEGDATTLFVQALWQRPLTERDDYQPGQQVTLDIGLRYALTRSLNAQLQLNLLWKDHDQGLNAEPDDSGGSYAFLSPGASYALTKQMQLYGFVQLPLYQYVNGTQLTADWSAVAGVSWKM
jgi:predicted porin